MNPLSSIAPSMQSHIRSAVEALLSISGSRNRPLIDRRNSRILRYCIATTTVLAISTTCWAASASDAEKLAKADQLMQQVRREAAAMPRQVVTPAASVWLNPSLDEHTDSRLLNVKFRDNARVRLRNGAFASMANAVDQPVAAKAVGRANELIASVSSKSKGGIQVNRMFSRSEVDLDAAREAAVRKGYHDSPDLNSHYLIVFDDAVTATQAGELAKQLATLDIFEALYFERKTNFKGFSPIDASPHTNSFTSLQGYLDAPSVSPTGGGGIDARWAWLNAAGGTGVNSKILFFEPETIFNPSGSPPGHEDLPTSYFLYNGPIPGVVTSYKMHGLATSGITSGVFNSWGITGIAYDAPWGFQSMYALGTTDQKVADALLAVIGVGGVMGPGDVINISAGKEFSGATTAKCGGSRDPVDPIFPILAVEGVPAVRAVIVQAVQAGVTVVESAGNTGSNLNPVEDPAHPCYGGYFNRERPDGSKETGAIIVGAINPIGRDPVTYHGNASNYGDRVDLSAWGTSVVTTGGDVRDIYCCATSGNPYDPTGNPSDVLQTYTASFGATSAAAPIVSGAAAIIQSVERARTTSSANPSGVPFTPDKVRALLKAYGTPQTSPSIHVGPMPNLQRVLSNMDLAYDWRFDVDGDGEYQALTDGLLIIRYLFGLKGATLINGAIGQWATRTTAADIETFLYGLIDTNHLLDIDDNGSQDALSDGLLLLRWMFGLNGTALTNGAIGAGAKRTDPSAIASFIRIHHYADQMGTFDRALIKTPMPAVEGVVNTILIVN